MSYLLLILAGLAVAVVIGVTWSLRRSRRVSSADRERMEALWRHVLTLRSPQSQIFEADKVLDEVMRLLGGTGAFADKLRKLEPRLKKAQPLWNAHKLRNRLAHEPGAHASANDAAQALRAFRAAMDDFLGS